MSTRSEDGWTLIELLVSMVVSLLILGAVLSLWSGAATSEQRNAARTDSIEHARTALERMTRDVREAVAVTGVTSSAVTLKVWTRALTGSTPSALHTVTYNCAGAGSVTATYRCMRADVTAGTTEPVVDRLTSSAVFTATAGKPNLEMRLSVRITDAPNPVSLHSGASPRNCTGALSACTGP